MHVSVCYVSINVVVTCNFVSDLLISIRLLLICIFCLTLFISCLRLLILLEIVSFLGLIRVSHNLIRVCYVLDALLRDTLEEFRFLIYVEFD